MSAANSPHSQSPSKQRGAALSAEQQKVLEKNLTNRPSVEHVLNSGITKDGGRFAAEKARLARSLASNALSRDLADRPDFQQLEHAGIVEQTHVAPSLAGIAKQLNKRLISDALNQKLYARESGAVAEDADKHLRATDVAPRLRSAKVALEHALKRNHVAHKLEIRPEAAQLMHQGILASPVAGRIAAVQRELGKRYTTDRVGHLLEQRPDVHTLEKEGVLRDVGVAPALQGIQKRLEHQLAKSNLFHALSMRPSVQELAARGVWQPNERANYYQSDSDDDDDEEEDEERYHHYHSRHQHQQQQQHNEQQAAAQEAYYRQQYAQQQQHVLMSPSSAAMRAAQQSFQSNPLQSPSTTASIAGIAAAEAAYRQYQQAAAQQAAQQHYAQFEQHQQQQQQQQFAFHGSSASRRSKSFHLTRLLLKLVAQLSESGEISHAEKSLLKELIVDGVGEVFDAAEQFDQNNDLYGLKRTLMGFAQRR